MHYGTFLQRYKMLSLHTWPSWRGPSVEGVTYLLRELAIGADEYAFGRTKIFIKSNKTVRGKLLRVVKLPHLGLMPFVMLRKLRRKPLNNALLAATDNHLNNVRIP